MLFFLDNGIFQYSIKPSRLGIEDDVHNQQRKSKRKIKENLDIMFLRHFALLQSWRVPSKKKNHEEKARNAGTLQNNIFEKWWSFNIFEKWWSFVSVDVI